jgi:hypothetical protein
MLLSENQYKKILFKIKQQPKEYLKKNFFQFPENKIIDFNKCFLKIL